MGADQIVSGGLNMDQLVGSLGGLVGRLVFNRTGLDGVYALTLRFSRPEFGSGPSSPALDDQPEIFTALREQLGLRLQPDKARLPVFIVDHIERPSEN